MKNFKNLLLVIFMAFTSFGCVTSFATFDSAEMLEPSEIEVTPTTVLVYHIDQNNSKTERVQNVHGIYTGYGISESFEIRSRLEIFSFPDDVNSFGQFMVFGTGLKFPIIEDHIAFYFPVGFGFGSGIITRKSFETHPAFLFTLRSSLDIELNISTKAILPIYSSSNNQFAVTAGFGIPIKDIILRPELGYLKDPKNDNFTLGFGLGLSIRNSPKIK